MPRKRRDNEEKEREKRLVGRKTVKNVGRRIRLRRCERKDVEMGNGDPLHGVTPLIGHKRAEGGTWAKVVQVW